MLIIVITDDCGFAAQEESTIDKLISNLRTCGFELTKVGSFSEFLGIKIKCNEKDGTLIMSQRGLILKTLRAANMEDSNGNTVPVSQVALGSDPDGEPMGDEFNCRSIVGMLLYLSGNTRPDIVFAVSQVARCRKVMPLPSRPSSAT